MKKFIFSLIAILTLSLSVTACERDTNGCEDSESMVLVDNVNVDTDMVAVLPVTDSVHISVTAMLLPPEFAYNDLTNDAIVDTAGVDILEPEPDNIWPNGLKCRSGSIGTYTINDFELPPEPDIGG